VLGHFAGYKRAKMNEIHKASANQYLINVRFGFLFLLHACVPFLLAARRSPILSNVDAESSITFVGFTG
jgi:hypothetical protein